MTAIPLAEGGLERAAHRRLDDAWLDEAFANPDVLVLMGNISCQALLGRKGITRLRGTWTEAFGRPVLPMFHPAYLLRTPSAKREAWADLLALQARLRQSGG